MFIEFQNQGKLWQPHDSEQDLDEEDFTDWEEDDEEGEVALKLFKETNVVI